MCDFTLLDIFIQKDFLLTTRYQCFSAYCLKLLTNPLHCGKSSTKTTSPWWALSWIVSRPISLCDFFNAPWQHKINLLKIMECSIYLNVVFPIFFGIDSIFFSNVSMHMSLNFLCVFRWRENNNIFQPWLQRRISDGDFQRTRN